MLMGVKHMVNCPDVLNKKVIKQMKKGTYAFNGVHLGDTYETLKLALGTPLKKNVIAPSKVDCYHEYPHQTLCVFKGNAKWKKRKFKLYAIDFNEAPNDLTECQVVKKWGKPKNERNMSVDEAFGVKRYCYKNTVFNFDEEGHCIGISYIHRKLEKKKWFIDDL